MYIYKYIYMYKYIYIYISIYKYIYLIFEAAIESWPEWDLNPRPLNSAQRL